MIYEAPHRIQRTLADLRAACGDDRPVAVCRELTKLYEEVVRGTLGEITIGEPRGEYVVVLAGRPAEATASTTTRFATALRTEIAAGSSKKDAVAAVTQTPRRAAQDGLRAGGRRWTECPILTAWASTSR